ncbi:MAG: Omp28-related outer membrane protein [Bacteroidetes bacterium]|nr:Omp28-related outer membrane protein [Bacteroidota bacterium]MCL2302134.1 Omp28-related outer membrane protein [Lentimicrobiaceae bacterium]
MKKFLSFFLIACFSATLFAQTIVSTEPSNRNAIIEEYTGWRCQWCPDGHRIANVITTNNPGRAYAINIHQGSFATTAPLYTTPWGNGLAGQYTISGYPCGTVNRGSAMLNRGQWTSAANAVIADASPVNVAAQGTINWETRKLTLLVEAYYTGNATESTNKLNVALLQNNILGPQDGLGLFMDMVVFEGYVPPTPPYPRYRHMHMLRDLITGQWGMDVTPTTTGSFWTHTIEYDIPAHVNNIPIELDDIEILVFMAENQKTIITGTEATLTYVNLPATNPRFTELVVLPVDCSNEVAASVKIKNAGETPITSLEFSYSVAGATPHTYVWNNGTINPIAIETILVPVEVQPNQTQNIIVDLVKVNNETVTPLTKNMNYKKEVAQNGDMDMKLIIQCDQYFSETAFKIFKPDGTILIQSNWFSTGGTREFNFTPTTEGCYRVEILDMYGDGITGGGERIRIVNSAGENLYTHNGQFGTILRVAVPVGTPPSPTFTITATAGENGIISPAGETVYEEGESATYTFTPDPDYEVEEVYINDEPMGLEKVTEYVFSEVDKDYTIHVTFRLIVGINEANKTAVSVAPNPVQNKLYVTGAYDKLEIISIAGQVLATAYNQPSVDVSRLAKGIYFVKIQTNGQINTFKVVK